MAWHYGTLGRATDAPGAAGSRRRQRRRAARRGRGHHQRGGTRDPRRGPGRTGSASVLEASAPQAIASDREPLHRRRCSRASGSAVAAFGAGGGGRASARNSNADRGRGDLALQPHRRARPRPVRAGGARPTGRRFDAGIAAAVSATKALIPDRAAFVMVVDGQIVLLEVDDALASRGLRVSAPDDTPSVGETMTEATDLYAELNTAFAAAPIVIDVPDGLSVSAPSRRHRTSTASDGIVTLPRVVARVGADASITIVDHHSSADVATLDAAGRRAGRRRGWLAAVPGGQPARPSRCWQIASQVARGQPGLVDAHGERRPRRRLRPRAHRRPRSSAGARSGDQIAVYFGERHQMHDFRTLQDHAAPKTTTDLLFKGAVAGHGTQRVHAGSSESRKEAPGTDGLPDEPQPQAQRRGVGRARCRTSRSRTTTCAAATRRRSARRRRSSASTSRAAACRPDRPSGSIVNGFFDEVLERLPVPDAGRPAARRRSPRKLEPERTSHDRASICARSDDLPPGRRARFDVGDVPICVVRIDDDVLRHRRHLQPRRTCRCPRARCSSTNARSSAGSTAARSRSATGEPADAARHAAGAGVPVAIDDDGRRRHRGGRRDERARDRGPAGRGRRHARSCSGIDLAVRCGEVHAVMGPNGSGKSTLSHVLMGRPGYEVLGGSVTLDGVDVLALRAVGAGRRPGCSSRMQYPTEVPGVRLDAMLTEALRGQGRRRRRRCDDRVARRGRADRVRRALPRPAAQRRPVGRREEAQRDAAARACCEPQDRHPRRARLGPRHRRAAGLRPPRRGSATHRDRPRRAGHHALQPAAPRAPARRRAHPRRRAASCGRRAELAAELEAEGYVP